MEGMAQQPASAIEHGQATEVKHPRIVVAIPCFNTEHYIADVVTRTKKYVDQVIVINDGSHDQTAMIAEAAGATVVNHNKNKGYGEAIKSCFNAAKENNADVLVIIDGDGQHNPDEIPQMIMPILSKEADFVIGTRFRGTETNMPIYRKLGIQIINSLYNFGSRTKISDTQCGFRAYSTKNTDTLSLDASGMDISVEILLEIRRNRFVIKEVPVSCLYHERSSTLNPIFHGIVVALSVIRIRIKNRFAERVKSAPTAYQRKETEALHAKFK
jgi:glycosyltransferase involved in cell wall biosynthesis